MKKFLIPAITVCMILLHAGTATSADIENWCGTYFEEDGRGYIRLAREDFGTGSDDCSLSAYYNRVEKSGTADIALDFTRNRTTISKWRKFSNHLIEIRGKFRNGYIDNARFIRDLGL